MKKLAILSLFFVSNLFAVDNDNAVNKPLVSVYELKAAISEVINRIWDIEQKVNVLQKTGFQNTAELGKLKVEIGRLKKTVSILLKVTPQIGVVAVQEAVLYTRPNGKEIDRLPYGTKVIIFAKDGDFCLVNGGVVKCSDLSFGGLNYGNQIQPNR